MRLVPVVTGQINQGFGWQNWGQIIITARRARTYVGHWETGVPGEWYSTTGNRVARQVGQHPERIAPADLAALNAHFAQEDTHEQR